MVTSNCTVLTEGDEYFAKVIFGNDQPSLTAYSADIVLYTPPFLKYDTVIETRLNEAVLPEYLSALSLQHSVLLPDLKIPPGHRYEILVRFTFMRATNKTGPSKVDIPWRASYKYYSGIWETVSVPMGSVTCQTDMDTWEYTAAGTCNSPQNLGMQSGAITTNQIVAAPLEPGSTVEHVRPGSLNHMAFGRRHPVDLYQPHRYIQINLPSLHTVTTFVITCTSTGYSAQTHTSTDGIAWRSSSNFNSTSGEIIPLDIILRYFRVTFDAPADLEIQMELFGCQRNSLSSNNIAYPPEFDWAPRQLGTMDHHLYVCDTKPATKLPSACFIYDVLNDRWKITDKQLHSLIGSDSTMSKFYGISQHGQYMISSNNGTKWSVIPNEYYDREEQSIQLVTKVPWVVPLDDHTITAHKVSTSESDFAADEAGIHRSTSVNGVTSWRRILDWETKPI